MNLQASCEERQIRVGGSGARSSRPVALVTGGSRGIGGAIAASLGRSGFDLTIAARDQAQLESAAASLRESGGRVDAVVADMADESQIAALAAAHVESFNRLDALVLAAGTGTAGPFESFPVRRLDSQFAVNVRGPFLLIQRLLPLLRATAARATRGAKIIAIASITGVAAEPGLGAYGASKAALISLCESITVTEASTGVSATAVSPGYVNTDMAAWVRDRIDPAQMITADDVAELVLAVCRLSRHAVVPNVVLTRPGEQLWRA